MLIFPGSLKKYFSANAQCGFLEVGSDLQIMVAGGIKDNGDVWLTTELFSFNDNAWSFSNNLPHPTQGATTVPWG